MSFSATDAAFEGFRLARRAPTAILWWSLAYVAMMAAAFAVAGASIFNLIALTDRLEGVAEPTVQDLMPVLQSYAALMGWITPLALVFGAVLNAAVARAVVRPSETAFGFLRLGGDELRVLVVSLVLGLLFGLGALLAGGVIGAVTGVVAAAEQPGLWLAVAAVVIVVVALFVWLGVRLSLAIPITVAERRIALFDSFRLTRGRFWPLLGMVVIVVVMSAIVSVLGAIIGMPVTLFTGGIGEAAAMSGESPAAIIQAMWPALLGWAVVNAVLSSLQLAVVYAPFAAAYRDIKGS